MTPEIEDVAKSILKNSVPEIWARNALSKLKATSIMGKRS